MVDVARLRQLSAGQRIELGPDLGNFLICADVLIGIDGFAKRRACSTGIANSAGDLSELAEHLGVEEPVLCAFRFVNGDSESSNALVQRAALSLDRRADFESASRGEVIAAALGLIESFGAAFVGEIQATGSDPDLREVELDHVLDNGVT